MVVVVVTTCVWKIEWKKKIKIREKNIHSRRRQMFMCVFVCVGCVCDKNDNNNMIETIVVDDTNKLVAGGWVVGGVAAIGVHIQHTHTNK